MHDYYRVCNSQFSNITQTARSGRPGDLARGGWPAGRLTGCLTPCHVGKMETAGFGVFVARGLLLRLPGGPLGEQV